MEGRHNPTGCVFPEESDIRLFSSSSPFPPTHNPLQRSALPPLCRSISPRMNHLKNLRAGISRIAQHVSTPTATPPEEEADSDVEGDGANVAPVSSTLPVALQMPEEDEDEPDSDAEPPSHSPPSSKSMGDVVSPPTEVPQEEMTEEEPEEDGAAGKGKEREVKAKETKTDPPPPTRTATSSKKTTGPPKGGDVAPVRKQSGRKTLPPQRHKPLRHGPGPSKNTGILTMQGVRATKVYKPKTLRGTDGKAISNTAAALTRSFVLTARHLASQSDAFIIPKGPFVRLVREIAEEVLSAPEAIFKLKEVRFKSSALAALLVASEDMLDLIFQQCGSAVITWFNKIQVDGNVFRVSAMLKGPESVKKALDAMPVTLQAKVEAELYNHPETRKKKKVKEIQGAKAETLAQRREKSAADRTKKKAAPSKATPKKVVQKK